MSMLAKYVEITGDRLAELLDEPDEVTELFAEPVVMGTPRTAAGLAAREQMQAEAARRAPQLLAQALARFNPSMRGALETNLKSMGINVEDLQAGKGGEAFLRLLMQRNSVAASLLGGGGAASGAARPANSGSTPQISLDKAWHGIHYLLSGQLDPTPSALGQVIMGGCEIGDDEMGYGPARYFTPAEVANTALELSAPTLEAQMQGRFDPAQMESLGIYPGGWDPSELGWLMDEYRKLRAFFGEASNRGAAVVTCLV